jgi:hypothetical protein
MLCITQCVEYFYIITLGYYNFPVKWGAVTHKETEHTQKLENISRRRSRHRDGAWDTWQWGRH